MIGYSDVLAGRESDKPRKTARFWKKCSMEIQIYFFDIQILTF